MTATYPEIPLGEKGKRLATGYSARRRDGTRSAVPIFQARGIAPAAGFASTASDLARFMAWQFRTLAGKDEKILDARTLREMERPHWVDPDFATFWGLGFATEKDGDTIYVGHGGSCPGFRSMLATVPAEKLGVVVLTNASGVNSGRFTTNVHKIVAPTLKEKAKAASATPDQMTPYLGAYDDFPWGGETIVFAWGDGLGMLSLPSLDPMKEMDKLRKVSEHTFRRVRKDDTLGETIRFEMGPDGRAARYWQHSNPSNRMPAAR